MFVCLSACLCVCLLYLRISLTAEPIGFSLNRKIAPRKKSPPPPPKKKVFFRSKIRNWVIQFDFPSKSALVASRCVPASSLITDFTNYIQLINRIFLALQQTHKTLFLLYDMHQGYKGIRQWSINSYTSPIMIHVYLTNKPIKIP